MSPSPSMVGPDVLVTGGAGLVGSALRAIAPRATFVSRRDGDLTDAAQTRRLFQRLRPRRVIHLAALVGGVKFNATRNADMLETNLRIDANVLSAAREAGVERLVGILSSCAFSMPAGRPANEDDLHVRLPFPNNLGYGMAKRILDLQCRLLHEQHRCRFSTIAPATMYGPGDNFDLDAGHVIGALIHRCLLARASGSPLVIWGTGRAVRQFTYAGDVARLLLDEIDRFDGPETMIVAPDQGITIATLAETIARVMGFTGVLDYTGDQEGELVKTLSTERFRARYPAFRFTPMDVALAETAEWFAGAQAGGGSRRTKGTGDAA